MNTLAPENGDDLTEFVNELKLSVVSPASMKTLKKNYEDNYFRLLTVFNDRCGAFCEQCLCLLCSNCLCGLLSTSSFARVKSIPFLN